MSASRRNPSGPATLVASKTSTLSCSKNVAVRKTKRLVKGESAALRIHCRVTERTGVICLTLKIVGPWARNPYVISSIAPMESLASVIGEPQGLPLAGDKPWLIADPRDPETTISWYTAARYFAKELVKRDSTLLTKRGVLAEKIVQSLTGAGIMKRGGKLPFDPGTVKKALSNVVLG